MTKISIDGNEVIINFGEIYTKNKELSSKLYLLRNLYLDKITHSYTPDLDHSLALCILDDFDGFIIETTSEKQDGNLIY